MTIKLLTALPSGGYIIPAGATISLDPSAEGGLVASKMAIWSTGTVDWAVTNGAAPTFNALGDREVEAVQALVLGGGIDVAGSRTITNAGPIVMGSIVIPGGTMGPNGVLTVEGRWITDTNAHNRTLACRFGGQTFASSLLSASGAVVNPFRYVIVNRGVQNSQSSHPSGANGMDATGASLTLGTVNTAVDQTLELVGTVATFSLTLEHFIVSVRNV